MLTDLALVRRVEAALAADLCAFADALGGSWIPVAGGVAVHTGLLGTRASGIGLDGPVTPAEIDRIVDFFAAHGDVAELELSPLADRSLVELLAARRARLHGFRDVFARTPSEPVTPSQVEIRPVGPDDVAAWADVLLDGFEVDGPAERDRFTRWNHMLATLAQAQLLTAHLDGRAVAASNVLLHDLPDGRVASLGGTATLPAFRRRGAQAALLAERLRIAAAAGCTLAVVTADPGSSSGRNARRTGFTLVATNVRLIL